jgi:hypothetical protein
MRRAMLRNARTPLPTYVPVPVSHQATWRLLGDVLFTVFDQNDGIIEMLVTNGLPYAVNAYILDLGMGWSDWGIQSSGCA